MEILSPEDAIAAARRIEVARQVLRTIPGFDIDLSYVDDQGVPDNEERMVRRLEEVHGSFFNESQREQLLNGGIEV